MEGRGRGGGDISSLSGVVCGALGFGGSPPIFWPVPRPTFLLLLFLPLFLFLLFFVVGFLFFVFVLFFVVFLLNLCVRACLPVLSA